MVNRPVLRKEDIIAGERSATITLETASGRAARAAEPSCRRCGRLRCRRRAPGGCGIRPVSAREYDRGARRRAVVLRRYNSAAASTTGTNQLSDASGRARKESDLISSTTSGATARTRLRRPSSCMTFWRFAQAGERNGARLVRRAGWKQNSHMSDRPWWEPSDDAGDRHPVQRMLGAVTGRYVTLPGPSTV